MDTKMSIEVSGSDKRKLYAIVITLCAISFVLGGIVF